MYEIAELSSDDFCIIFNVNVICHDQLILDSEFFFHAYTKYNIYTYTSSLFGFNMVNF